MLKKENNCLKPEIFRDKFKPVLTGSVIENCSSCVFRNKAMYCGKLSPVCSYVSQKDESFGTVYWVAKNSGDENGLLSANPPRWVRDFFKETASNIQRIAGKMVMDALCEQK